MPNFFFTNTRWKIAPRLGLTFLILAAATVLWSVASAAGPCDTPTVITGGGSYAITTSATCFKYVNAANKWGGMFTVMNGSSTAANTMNWYGGRSETVTTCINDSQILNGNGAQLNNFTVAKDSTGAMYLTITGSAANTVSISIQNWQNGTGCSASPTPVGSGPTNTSVPATSSPTATMTRTNTAIPLTATNTAVGPTTSPTGTMTLTNTPVPPTATRTNTATLSPTAVGLTATRTNTAVLTNTPTRTLTPLGPTNTPTSPGPPGLTIQINKGNGIDNTQETGFNYLVKNTGTTALSNLSARIYFTTDGSNAGSGYVLEKYYDQSNVATISGPTLDSGSTYYFTVSYGTASLAAGAQWEFQTALHLSSWASTYSGANDWFHSGYAVGALPVSYTSTSSIPGYASGSLVWGSTPSGGGATATPTQTVGASNTPVSPTPTRTNTPAPATVTNTPTGPTATRTNTPAVSLTPTSTPNGTNHSPNTPTITEPNVEGKIVNPADVHMETAPFSDPDAGQIHVCSDWEIWNAAVTERVWFTSCIGGVEKVHTHLGDGHFENSLLGHTELLPTTNYVLRVRHKDNSGDPATEWSAYAQRGFQTSAVSVGDPNKLWTLQQAGYEVQVVATGLQLPVNIAFVPNPGTQPTSPLYYVTELYGNIKVVTRAGAVSDYATGLLNFNPTGNFPGSGEQGVAGLVIDPVSGDIFAGMLYEVAGGNHYPKVVRFHSTDGGLTAATQTVILDMAGETQGQSHQISNFSLGPDGKLYVHMGDGFDATKGQDLTSFRGKVLRLNLDGTAPIDNPLYNAADGITARDYVYAYGLRNPFGGAWRASDNGHYEVENGPSVDRFAKIVANRNYLYDGSDGSMANFAIYNWNPAHAPVNLAFVQTQTFNGSGFPAGKLDHAFVSESGGTYASGPQSSGKRIVEFTLDASGNRLTGPTTLLEYTGTGKASVVGLTAGPDGLYFTDLYKDLNFVSAIDRGANVLRVQFVGAADFSATPTGSTTAPLTVQFTDLSTVPSPTNWQWDFGDGTTSTQQNPSHTYTSLGSYSVRLNVTGATGTRTTLKTGFINIGAAANGIRGEYYDNMDLTNLKVTRTDPNVNFDWAAGSPDPSIGVDTFSARWTGQVQPRFSETYTFYTNTDDGVRLWVNNQLLVDKWVDQAATEWSGTIALTAGQKYVIKMEYYENGSGALAKLSWSSPSQAKEIIPQSQLFLP